MGNDFRFDKKIVRGGVNSRRHHVLPFPAGVRGDVDLLPAHPMAEKLAGRAVVRRSRNQRGIALFPDRKQRARVDTGLKRSAAGRHCPDFDRHPDTLVAQIRTFAQQPDRRIVHRTARRGVRRL